MLRLIKEGKEELFCKRQKPITMDDKNPGGYMLVDEYVSDDFASGLAYVVMADGHVF